VKDEHAYGKRRAGNGCKIVIYQYLSFRIRVYYDILALMYFDGPEGFIKSHEVEGPSKHMKFLGPSKHMRFSEGGTQVGPSKHMRFLGLSKHMRFQEGKGPSKHMRFLGPPKHMRF
jgi:hypothetical protein